MQSRTRNFQKRDILLDTKPRYAIIVVYVVVFMQNFGFAINQVNEVSLKLSIKCVIFSLCIMYICIYIYKLIDKKMLVYGCITS